MEDELRFRPEMTDPSSTTTQEGSAVTFRTQLLDYLAESLPVSSRLVFYVVGSMALDYALLVSGASLDRAHTVSLGSTFGTLMLGEGYFNSRLPLRTVVTQFLTSAAP